MTVEDLVDVLTTYKPDLKVKLVTTGGHTELVIEGVRASVVVIPHENADGANE